MADRMTPYTLATNPYLQLPQQEAPNPWMALVLYPKAAQSIFGRKIDQIIQWGLSGANAKAMERLLDVMQEPKVAAALMKKATEGKLDMAIPLLQRARSGGCGPGGEGRTMKPRPFFRHSQNTVQNQAPAAAAMAYTGHRLSPVSTKAQAAMAIATRAAKVCPRIARMAGA